MLPKHEIVVEVDYNCMEHTHYRCATCLVPVYWDGVFEGRWLHAIRGER